MLILAAAPKIRHPISFKAALYGYSMFSPTAISMLQYAVPAAEVIVGLALLLRPRRWNAVAALALFSSFSVVLVSAWWRGLELTCGCFGRVDSYLHGLHQGMLIHICLNIAVALGLVLYLIQNNRLANLKRPELPK